MSIHNSSKFKQWFKRIIIVLVLLELVYLVVFNIVLNTAFVHKQVNTIEPEKFQLQWESAWTLYPGRIHMEKLTARGVSGSKEWQADVDSASASLSLFSLMAHTVKISSVKLANITYTQQQAFAQPTSTQKGGGSKTTAIAKNTKTEREHWYVELKGIQVDGQHSIETDQFKGDLDADIDLDLALSTKDGLLSVKNSKMNISINTLKNHKGEVIVKKGKIESQFAISPVEFNEKRKSEWLKYLVMESAITAEMENLNIFNTQLQKTRKIGLSGKGTLKSQIHLQKGILLPGTKLQLDAGELSVSKRDYLVRGDGKIVLAVTNENPETLESKIHFGDFRTFFVEDENATAGSVKREVTFFQGKGLAVNSKVSSTLYPNSSKHTAVEYAELELPPVTIEDLSLLQPYIPQKWDLNLKGGQGKLQAKAEIRENGLNAVVKFNSKETEIAFSEQNLSSDLDLAINVKVSTTPSLHADLSGTHIALTNTKLFSQKASVKRESKLWSTKLNIEEGKVVLPLPENKQPMRLSQIVKKYKVKDILHGAEGKIKVAGNISQLEWINLLSKSSLDLSLSGSNATVDAELLIEKGALSTESMARVRSKNLEVGLLEYQFKGEGGLMIRKNEGEKSPVLYTLEYENASMKRKNEKEAMVENVLMKLDREADNLSFRGSKWDKPLHLQIFSAKVKSVSLYNQYFPENSPFSFIDGSADLSADILLESNNTKGYIKLVSKGMIMKVDDQKISARLSVDTKIVGGEAKKMQFDISGSTIVLDRAKVAGEKVQHSKEGWRADIKFKKADITWKKPLRLKSEIALGIKDSRPIVALIDNKHVKFDFITKLLIAEDLQGNATVNMEDNTIMIPHALIKSNKIDIGIKGIITPLVHNGIVFFGHKNIRAAMEIKDGKRSFDIFSAKKSFDRYVVPSPTPSN